jgi:hypothetical protein
VEESGGSFTSSSRKEQPSLPPAAGSNGSNTNSTGSSSSRPADLKGFMSKIGADFHRAGGVVAGGFQKAFDETSKGLQKVAQVRTAGCGLYSCLLMASGSAGTAFVLARLFLTCCPQQVSTFTVARDIAFKGGYKTHWGALDMQLASTSMRNSTPSFYVHQALCPSPRRFS